MTPMLKLYQEVILDGKLYRVRWIDRNKTLNLERLTDHKQISLRRKEVLTMQRQHRLKVVH